MSVFKRYTSSNEWEQLQGSAETLPSQSGNRGKFLETNGTTVSWQDVDSFIYQGPTPPESPVEGDLWIDTSINSSEGRLIPPGGASGQVFAKTSSADYNVGWVDLNINTLGGVPDTRTINGKSLDSNITLSASDVGAAVEIKISSFDPDDFVWDSNIHTSDSDSMFPYRCAIPAIGATSSTMAEVIFGTASAMSGLYAPITECGNDIVYIWASEQTNPTVLSILLHK